MNGYSDAQLQRIARQHGQRASQEGWWQRAHLTSGSGELRRLLAEGGFREEKTRKGSVQGGRARGRGGFRAHERAATASLRARERAIAHASATGRGTDLPF